MPRKRMLPRGDERKPRNPNTTVREEFSLRCYDEDRVLLKISHVVERRTHCKGRGGRIISHAPKTVEDRQSKQDIFYRYLLLHQARKSDIFFRPESPISQEKVIYVFVPNNPKDIRRVRRQANYLGFNCYQEPINQPPPDMRLEVAS